MVATNLNSKDGPRSGASAGASSAVPLLPTESKGVSGPGATEPIDVLSEFRAQQLEILAYIREYQVLVSTVPSLEKLVCAADRIVACAKANFSSQEAWLARENDPSVRSHCLAHRLVIEEVNAFQSRLRQGELKSAPEMAHGLDGIVTHYLVDNLFGVNGLVASGWRAASDKRSIE